MFLPLFFFFSPHSFSCTWLPLGLAVIFPTQSWIITVQHVQSSDLCCPVVRSFSMWAQLTQSWEYKQRALFLDHCINMWQLCMKMTCINCTLRFFFWHKKTQHGNNYNKKKTHLFIVNSLCRPIWKTIWYENCLYTMMESLLMVIVAVAMATKWQHGYLCIILLIIFLFTLIEMTYSTNVSKKGMSNY